MFMKAIIFWRGWKLIISMAISYVVVKIVVLWLCHLYWISVYLQANLFRKDYEVTGQRGASNISIFSLAKYPWSVFYKYNFLCFLVFHLSLLRDEELTSEM